MHYEVACKVCTTYHNQEIDTYTQIHTYIYRKAGIRTKIKTKMFEKISPKC